MIDFQEEKGLFTFYREQAEQQQKLKQIIQQRKLQKKRKCPSTMPQQKQTQKKNHQKYVQSDILYKPIQQKLSLLQKQKKSKEKIKLKFKKFENKKYNTDCAVVIINGANGEGNPIKYYKQQLEKRPLSILMYDLKFQEYNKDNLCLPKNKIGSKSSHESTGKQKLHINQQQVKLYQFQAYGDQKKSHNSLSKEYIKNLSAEMIKIQRIYRGRSFFKKYDHQNNEKVKQDQSIKTIVQKKNKAQNLLKLPLISLKKKVVNESFDFSSQIHQDVFKKRKSNFDKQNFYVYDKIRKIQHPQQYHFSHKHKKKSFIGGVIDMFDENQKNQIITSIGEQLSVKQNSKLLQLLRKIKISEK